jgi:hypothetical protein
VAYTSIGGLSDYTDTIQWLSLGGLVFIGIPVAYNAVVDMMPLKQH